MSEREMMMMDMVKNLAILLTEQQPELTLEEAMSRVINSETYQLVLNDNTRLYYQSPRYVFSFLDSELKNGKVG